METLACRLFSVWRLKVLCLSVLLAPAIAWSAATPHGHSRLERSPSLTFTSIFEHAIDYAPEATSMRVRYQQAESYQRLGNSWVSGSPRMQLSYIDDSSFENIGQTEIEAGLELPLWNLGAKRDSLKLGQSYSEEVTAWQSYFQWQIAGRLRTVLANTQQAEVVFEQAQRARLDAQKLVEIAEGLYRAGNTSKDTVLQAQSLLLEQETNLLRADAALVDAERMYTSLTGLNVLPQQIHTETQASIDEIPLNHPLLQYLGATVTVANAQVRQALQEAKGNPTLSVGVRHQRGDTFEEYTDSLVVGISIPLGSGAYASAKSSDALRTKVDAEVQYHTAHRQLLQQLHEVEHELRITAASISLNQQQLVLSQQRSGMARKAFDVGETTMTQVVHALQQYHRAKAEYQLMLLKQQRLIFEFNQIVGKLP